ncbi:MAG TPA: alpha-L-glutamate ligase-like protein [Myxococcota bacterium]|nr:alpha-L-glutamate ligase-like protein [Myxococcota bacterium]
MWRRLRAAGVLGINGRNALYTLRHNARRLYPLVDDKLATKRLCEAAGIPAPRLLAVAYRHYELRRLLAELAAHQSFVLKPARGAMGNGIVVVLGHRGEGFVRSGGREISREGFLYHAAGIISGLYSLAGHSDVAMVEERLESHPALAALCTEGVPDVRVIVYRGYPVMSMTRLPTAASAGRANLHQGAIGAGIELASGRTHRAILRGREVGENPDTGRRVLGVPIPAWERVLETAVRATDQTGLGYVGADVVVDAARGAMILEMNARPGLAIQLANGAGLLHRLRAVDELAEVSRSLSQRIELGREIAARARARARRAA